MLKLSKHTNNGVSQGFEDCTKMFYSFEFWSFDIVSSFVLRYSNLEAVEKHDVGPF